MKVRSSSFGAKIISLIVLYVMSDYVEISRKCTYQPSSIRHIVGSGYSRCSNAVSQPGNRSCQQPRSDLYTMTGTATMDLAANASKSEVSDVLKERLIDAEYKIWKKNTPYLYVRDVNGSMMFRSF